jgi:hypothetical protein
MCPFNIIKHRKYTMWKMEYLEYLGDASRAQFAAALEEQEDAFETLSGEKSWNDREEITGDTAPLLDLPSEVSVKCC